MSIADGFLLTLCCDFCPDQRQTTRAEFCERSARDAYRMARKHGWKMYLAQSKAKCRRCLEPRSKEA